MYDESRDRFQNIQGFCHVAQDSDLSRRIPVYRKETYLAYSTSIFISLHRDRSEC